MRPSDGERRGRFPSGKVSLFQPLDPLDPLPPRGQGEPREGKGAEKGRGAYEYRPYKYEPNP